MATSFAETTSKYLVEHQRHDPLLTVVGIGVIVVLNELNVEDDGELKILAVRQVEAKPETGKVDGSLSLIQETIKMTRTQDGIVPETPTDTLRGAMEEVVDANGVSEVGHHFHQAVFDRRPEIPLHTLPSAAGGLEVVIYDGLPEYPFTPAATAEVARPRWITGKNFLTDPTARDTSKELVDHAIQSGLLIQGLVQYLRGQTEPVFTNGFPFERFRRARNKLPDITWSVR